MRTADAMALAAGRLIRVASVPASHVYVRHLADPLQDDGITRLADPAPSGPVTVSGQWWPPAMLSASWVREHRREFDVFHIQFGFDAEDVTCLQELVKALRKAGKPLIYTVHDLRNPHHHNRRDHDAQLDVLIPAADALITLTEGAAREIESRGAGGRQCSPIRTWSGSGGWAASVPALGSSGSGSMRKASAPAWTRFRSSGHSPV